MTKLLAVSITLLLLFTPISAQAVDSGSSYGPDPAPAPSQSVAPADSPSATPMPISNTPPTVATQLASIRSQIGELKYREALTALKKVEKAQPKNADVKNLLGFTSRKLKNYTAASSYYKSALKLNPKHLGALEYQGELYITQKKISMAKQNLAKLKSLCGTSCPEYLDLKKAIGNR